MQLEQIIYVSRSTRRVGSVLDVSDILEQARRHNRPNSITGALAFTDTHFVQILEGSHSALDVLLLRLMLDERHAEMNVLDRASIEERSFAEWSMISPRMTPSGQGRLVRLLADDVKALKPYRDLMLELCAEQLVVTNHNARGV